MNIPKITRIIKNTALLASSQLAGKAVLLILSIFIARHLKETGFGQYTLIITIMSFFVLLANFGLGTIAFREVSKDYARTDQYLANILTIRLIFGVISFVLMILVMHLLRYPAAIISASYIFGVTIITTSMIDTFTSVFNAQEKAKHVVLLSLSLNLSSLILGILAVRHGLHALALSALASGVFAVVIAFALSSRIFTFKLNDVKMDFCKGLLAESLPLMILSFVGIIYFRIDVVILSKLKTSADVGLYNAAYKIMDSFMIFSNAIILAVFPYFARYAQRPIDEFRKHLDRLIVAVFAAGLLASVIVFTWAEEIVLKLFGPSFAQSVIPLKILIWTVPLIYINAVLLYTLIAFRFQTRLAYLVIAATAVNCVLNIALIPRYSYMASSVITVVTEFLMMAGYYYLIRKLLYSRNYLYGALNGTEQAMGN